MLPCQSGVYNFCRARTGVILEWDGLEGSIAGHLVQLSYSGRVILEATAQDVIQTVLEYVQ